jgi:hypothetical protein
MDAPQPTATDAATLDPSTSIAWLFAISLLATVVAKLPQLVPSLDAPIFYLNNAPLLGTLPVAAFLYALRRPPRRIALLSTAGALLAILLANLAPGTWDASDLHTLGRIHLPIALWGLVALPFIGVAPRAAAPRVAFVAFSGEVVLLTVLLVCGGIAMSLLTYWIFRTLGIDIANWYARNVVVWGLVTAPLVATLMAAGARPLALVGRVAIPFVPLLLVTLGVYLIAIAVSGFAPLTQRDFLANLNAVMVGAAFVSLAVICDRTRHPEPRVTDHLNLGLVGLTLLITGLALGAIVVRLISAGIEPVRLVVFGTDAAVLPLLAGVVWHYARFTRGLAPLERVTDWIACYLPILPAWALVVAVLPFVFS